MSIFLTGDLHGIRGLRKLNNRHFNAEGLTKDDYLIILGDFGLIFETLKETHMRDMEESALDWLDSRPWTTLFIDGNHENHARLAEYPTDTWHGGKVHRIRDSVIHLMRGEVYDIDGLSFLSMGGAASIDKDRRIENENWWASEIPDDGERENCVEHCGQSDWEVDYVLTHDCPINVVNELMIREDLLPLTDEYENWLQYIADNLDFTRWFFGHYHFDIPSLGIGGKYTCVMDCIVELNGAPTERMLFPSEIDFSEMPKKGYGYDFTLEEICEATGIDEDYLSLILSCVVQCWTCAVRDNGNIAYYLSDLAFSVFPNL